MNGNNSRREGRTPTAAVVVAVPVEKVRNIQQQ